MKPQNHESLVKRLCAATLAATGATAHATDMTAAAETLRSDLFAATRSLLAPSGLSFDERHAQVATSRPVAPGETFSVRPQWRSVAPEPPGLPLSFELRPTDGEATPLRATLLASLQRDVLVVRQRRERGTPLRCEDLEVLAKPLRLVPARAWQPPCALAENAHARRLLLAGDVLRSDDTGPLPDVAAQRPVRVRVVVGSIALEKNGTALADALEGETVRVRVPGIAQAVNGRVLARDLVALESSE